MMSQRNVSRNEVALMIALAVAVPSNVAVSEVTVS
jgi:hypothetical protein